MKTTIPLTILFFLFLSCLNPCKAGFNVDPRELTISMEEFIHGDSTKDIQVINSNDYEINISWYISHPEPLDLIRPNKTTVPDLSWIDVKPKWKILPPNTNSAFSIYLDIPEQKENLNQNWEVWITFREQGNQFINIENAVRVYIDTPTDESAIKNDSADDQTQNQVDTNMIIIGIIIIIVFLLLITLFLKIKKKKS